MESCLQFKVIVQTYSLFEDTNLFFETLAERTIFKRNITFICTLNRSLIPGHYSLLLSN